MISMTIDNIIPKEIKITLNDLNNYFLTLSNSSKIWKYRILIIHAMPKNIRKEFKTRINDLVKVDSKGIYKIIAYNASLELKKYLDTFSIILEN